MNCSEIRSVTSSLFIHRLFAFCRHSPQLMLRLDYVSSRPSAVGKLRRTVADQPGVDWFGQHLRVYRYGCTSRVSVASKPACSTSVFSARRAELGGLRRNTIVARSLTG